MGQKKQVLKKTDPRPGFEHATFSLVARGWRFRPLCHVSNARWVRNNRYTKAEAHPELTYTCLLAGLHHSGLN